MSSKRLYRTSYNKMIGGICNGIAEYFDIDPTIVRILAILFCFAGGCGVLAYLIGLLIIPVKEC